MTAERLALIQQIVRRQSSVSVAELARLCNTSEVTIRRDLTQLEQEGIVTRVRGGAILADLAPEFLASRFEEHRAVNYPQKKAIGEAAAGLIKPGDTILVDAGSTTLELVRHLAGRCGLTVITTSIRIAEELEQVTGVNTILTGGTLRSRTTSLVNPMLEQSLASVIASKAFLGMSGVSTEHGFTTGDFAEADVKRQLIAHAREIIVLADNSKLGRVSPAFVAKLDQVHLLVTDEGAAREDVQNLESHGLKVLIAKVNQPR
ncbi:MAG: DeoR/GlpR family DNA-binding transcription regulator [Betaproteobacteria bacterium]